MVECKVYVNECSAVGQMADAEAAEQAVKAMLDCLKLLESCDKSIVTIKKYFSRGLFSALLSQNVSIDTLRDRELRHLVKLSLRDAFCWNKTPLADGNAIYRHCGHDVSQTSMSEAYEQDSSMLVNFVSSYVEEPIARIEKIGSAIARVMSYSDGGALLSFVLTKGWRRNQYNLSSSVPPRDEESILSDTNRFEATVYRYNGRVIYRRKDTGHLCYIDSKHYGPAAHIEEFNEATKVMVGTLKINEDVEHHSLSKRERSRRLKLD